MNKIKNEFVFQLFIAVMIGIVLGFIASESVISVIGMVKYILGQIIFFMIPLIIIAFVGSSISNLQSGASKLLGFAIFCAYFSTLGAATLSMVAGFLITPHLQIASEISDLKALPDLIFELNIPPIMPVMSALVLSIILGLSISWSKAEHMRIILNEFQHMILSAVSKVIMPILPFFIGGTFAELAYEGSITTQLPVFIGVLFIVLLGHLIWLFVLYTVAGFYAKVNPKEVFKHYAPAYLTAIGTMSSAATLPVALASAKKSKVLREDVVDFGVPLFTNIHLCGSVLTEVFFVMVVSILMYGGLPTLPQMMLFIVLLGIFGIGAPGVPGGTVMASLGLITGILGFDASGTALVLTIFALQDSFGTACNVTGDGALTLMLSKYADKNKI